MSACFGWELRPSPISLCLALSFWQVPRSLRRFAARFGPGLWPGPLVVTASRLRAHSATVTAWPWCWRARQLDTAGRQAAGHRGCRARQPPHRRARVRRTRRKLPPRNGETPGEPQPPTTGHLGRSFPLDCLCPSSPLTGGAVRPGAPKARP